MNRYFRSAYKFGSLGGILCVLAFFTLAFLRPDPTSLNLIFGFVIIPLSVFVAIKFYKEYSNEGFLSFAEGMTVGFVTYSLIALISGIGLMLILSVSPALFEDIKASKLEILLENKETITSQMGENSFSSALLSVQDMTNWDVAINDVIWKVIAGFFFTIIISIILRKNPN
jgi:hypothetical protein